MTRRLLIVEEGLQSMDSGHWYDTIKAIVRSATEVDVKPTVLAHVDATREITEGLGALPVLKRSAWDGSYKGTTMLRYIGVFRHNLGLYREVAKFLRQSEGFDCVFAPTVLVHHVLAWVWIARRFAGGKLNRMTLLFLNPPGYHDAAGALRFPRKSMLLKFALRLFQPFVASQRVTLAAETARTAQHFEEFCGLKFAVAAQPIEPGPSRNDTKDDVVLTFGAFGFARHEQGTDLLQSAIGLLHRQSPHLHLRFIIRWKEDFTATDGAVITRDQKLARSGMVEFIGPADSTEEYRTQFSRADAVVLPYRVKSYRDRGSRIAAEAATMGIPMICTEGTWLEQLMRRCGAGMTFRDSDVDDLARVIENLANDFAIYKVQANANIAKAREYFSPRHYIERLFDGTSANLAGVSF
jgi:glycosyltransferase involved in cell wall biosynthesis